MPQPDHAEANADQVAYWNDRAGLIWTALQERIDATFAPITAAAIAAAAPAAGERVIDVGCGCGATLLETARAVGPHGSVLGVDVSHPMLARARERIQAEGLSNTRLIAADATTYPFAAGQADLLFSRFGVMFFADPAEAFTNLRHAMRPGGRLLFAAWRPMAENAWFMLPLDAARHLLPPEPPADPLAPGPFAFADPGRVIALLEKAGWRDVRPVRHDATLQMSPPGHPEQASDYLTRVGALARLLVEADDETRARATAAVAAAVKPHDGPNGVVLGASIWLVSAQA